MKYKTFDVVELNSGEKATILNTRKSIYRVRITDDKGESQKLKDIQSDEIKNIIYSRDIM